MHGRLAQLAARQTGRPVLMERGALEYWINRIQAVDARAFERPGRFAALVRKLGKLTGPRVMEDGEAGEYVEVPLGEGLIYEPRYIGEPEDTGFGWALKDGVALMCVDTPLLDEGFVFCGSFFHGYDTLLLGMREAAADPRVQGVFLKLNTPGGIASGEIMTLAQWMRDNRAAAGGKPIWVYAKMACSAGYWIGSQADRIISPEMAYVGSIGCYQLHEDWSAAYEKDGLRITEFAEFEDKTALAPWKPVDASAAADAMAEVHQVVQLFAADVEAGRPGLTYDKIAALRSRAFYSRHDDATRSGLALGLIDEIAAEEDAFAALCEQVSPASNNRTGARAGRVAATQKEASMADLKRAGAAARAAHAEDIQTPEDDKNKPADETNPENPPPPEDENTPEDEDKPEPEASRIAASAEAKTHPEMALAAIQSGATLVQFQTMVAAAGTRAPENALDRLMAKRDKSPGVDAPKADSAGESLVAYMKAKYRPQK
jgi:ClpP class serine protease